MWNNFFSHIDIKPENVNILNGNAEDLEAECTAYEAKMKAAGGVDLFLGGIGPDGISLSTSRVLLCLPVPVSSL